MTEILTGKQVLALLAQDEPPEIEMREPLTKEWIDANISSWAVADLRNSTHLFRIKPTPQRRLGATLESGEYVLWSEPVREALKNGQDYWYVDSLGIVNRLTWDGESCDLKTLAFGNIHLTKEAALEHADALRKINTQGVV